MAGNYSAPLTSRTSSDHSCLRADVSASGQVLTTVFAPDHPSLDAAPNFQNTSSPNSNNSVTGSRRESYNSAMLNTAALSTVDDEPVRIEKKDEDERETWDKKAEFLLAVIGFAVDLGNVRPVIQTLCLELTACFHLNRSGGSRLFATVTAGVRVKAEAASDKSGEGKKKLTEICCRRFPDPLDGYVYFRWPSPLLSGTGSWSVLQERLFNDLEADLSHHER